MMTDWHAMFQVGHSLESDFIGPSTAERIDGARSAEPLRVNAASWVLVLMSPCTATARSILPQVPHAYVLWFGVPSGTRIATRRHKTYNAEQNGRA